MLSLLLYVDPLKELAERTRKLATIKSQTLDSHKQLACALSELQESDLSVDGISKMRRLVDGFCRSDQMMLHDQASHLLLNFLIWDWMERMVIESTDTSPIGRLRLRVADVWHHHRPTGLELDASEFYPEIPKGKLTSSFALAKQANMILSPTYFHQIVLPIIASWFGVPKTRPKALYVRAILKSPFGINAFYLEPFVMAANNIQRNVFGIGRNCQINADMLQGFANRLCNHPICQSDSSLGSLASSIIADSQSAFPLDEGLWTWWLPPRLCLLCLTSTLLRHYPRSRCRATRWH